jgi:hypothetical protein
MTTPPARQIDLRKHATESQTNPVGTAQIHVLFQSGLAPVLTAPHLAGPLSPADEDLRRAAPNRTDRRHFPLRRNGLSSNPDRSARET